jgi:hypothetical protein
LEELIYSNSKEKKVGYAKDLGKSEVHDLCTITGYPRNKWGRLLNPLSLYNGVPIENWNRPGTELYNLTNPYGHLCFACGTGDDFICWDYARIHTVIGDYMILDAAVNSETGGFIDGFGYKVMPARSIAERHAVLTETNSMVDRAYDWMCAGDIRHSVWGWNQKPEYFRNCVAAQMFSWEFPKKWTERMYRMNTKLVQRAVSRILSGGDLT